jgi:hypothetical protein
MSGEAYERGITENTLRYLETGEGALDIGMPLVQMDTATTVSLFRGGWIVINEPTVRRPRPAFWKVVDSMQEPAVSVLAVPAGSPR